MTWRTTERQWLVDIDSDLISFWIRLVSLVCEHLGTLLHLELKMNNIWEESLCKRGLLHLSAVLFQESRHVSSLGK
ncbi:hypothetical protein Tco_0918514 [Tanacetum coccineum]